MTRQMNLVYMLPKGPTVHHHGMWRHPFTDNPFLDPDWWDRMAKTLEAACFDAIFCGDSLTFYNDVYIRKGGATHFLDPLPLAMVMARATRHIGLAVTISTSFFEPYALARSLGSADVLSGGRMAWNVITSAEQREADVFGKQLPAKQERYDRADEVLEACFKLWGSIEPDAFVLDRESGVFMDSSKVHSFEYEGKYVKTKGPLPVPPSAQGHPVIMQAGSSPRGREFAARWAEVVFTLQNALPDMQAFYSDMKTRAQAAGRRPEDCRILTSVDPVVGETESIAREKAEYANSLVDQELGVALVSSHLGIDLTGYPMDARLDELEFEEVASQGSFDVLVAGSKADGLTLGQTCQRYATSELCPQLVGTPEQVADHLEEYFVGQGCDGFIITPVVLPGSAEEFARTVVPILQKRGLFRTEYPGTTLRSTLVG